MRCPSCDALDTLAINTEPEKGIPTARLICSSCERSLYISRDDPPSIEKLSKWAAIAWAYPEGRCPTCPADPMKERRARCPICREWITYRPEHPGHRYFSGITGRWSKSFFKPANLAWMGHMNANADTHQGDAFVNAFYEKI